MSAVVSMRATDQAGLLFLAQAKALALNHQGVAVMKQAVENRGGEDVVAEDGAPLRDELIGRDQQAGAFVTTRDELEKQVGAAPLERQVPELVDDQQLRLCVKH